MTRSLNKWIERLAVAMAILGGIVLTALVLLICLSIVGRTLNGAFHGPIGAVLPGLSEWAIAAGVGPINGDFELVEAGVAFAIFAFLPICQLHGSHATVDIFTRFLPGRLNRLLEAAIAGIFAAVLVLIAIQLEAGMQSKLRSGQTTFLLQFPVWWGYAASLLGASVAALIASYIAIVRWIDLFRGHDGLAEFEDRS